MRALCWLGLLWGAAIGAAAVDAWAQVGHALEFDGIDDLVMVDDPVNVTGPLTLEAWIRCNNFDGGRILSNRHYGDGYELDIGATGWLRFTIDGIAEGMCDVSAHLGEWIHVAATWEGPSTGGIIVYVNGEVEDEDSCTMPMTDAIDYLAIGVAGWGSYFFDGAIDEVRIFDTVVDQETIRIWMTRRMDAEHPAYEDLQGAWSFEENTGQITSGTVVGRDGQLGGLASEDIADPTWIASGMVSAERSTWGTVKRIFGH